MILGKRKKWINFDRIKSRTKKKEILKELIGKSIIVKMRNNECEEGIIVQILSRHLIGIKKGKKRKTERLSIRDILEIKIA